MDLVLTSSAAAAAAYLMLIGMIALIASIHPDDKRRADAHKVLDKLMRFGRSPSRRR
ncbi:hypothetical protein [Actinoplanes couchii]|uniref:hypothetical protein n=1 Tax=Actinoplanes couchii TaxID=403638 RepID=UPI0028548101|nr:hypothetical protein [Actinoplanes couchii]MDR6316295.1 hypothetical protein [Actinoplanes couchii]